MRPGDLLLIQKVEDRLLSFNKTVRKIPGIRSAANRNCLARQIVDSIRRVKYVTTISEKQISESITNPILSTFHPLKSAVWHKNNGNVDEAFWLIFLATHFGRNNRTGWGLVRNVYGQLNGGDIWTWESVTSDLNGFQEWIDENLEDLKETGKFSNHRKYESLRKSGEVVSSYIKWIGEDFSHQMKIESLINEDDDSPRTLFDTLYHSMNSVYRFGRTAKFDYLCMIGKIGLAEIQPGLTYMAGATGPIFGARLLFRNDSLSPKEVEPFLAELNDHLDLHFGMQILEDSLCNWQKNPGQYEYFGG
jgi:Alpha-glutamyl/putrescinyl thymine pyrophosphorylase clade 3